MKSQNPHVILEFLEKHSIPELITILEVHPLGTQKPSILEVVPDFLADVLGLGLPSQRSDFGGALQFGPPAETGALGPWDPGTLGG